MARTSKIEVRLSEAERAAWQEAADREERSASDFVRRTVNAALREAASPARAPDGPIFDGETIRVNVLAPGEVVGQEALNAAEVAVEDPAARVSTEGGADPTAADTVPPSRDFEDGGGRTPGDPVTPEAVAGASGIPVAGGSHPLENELPRLGARPLIEGGAETENPSAVGSASPKAARAPLTCRNAALHRKGVFCKVCQTVPS